MHPVVLAFDTETRLITPEVSAPDMACLTYSDRSASGAIFTGIHHANEDARDIFTKFLAACPLLAGHNVAYDMAVCANAWPELLPDIFAAYDADRVTDTMHREQLLCLAAGKFKGSVDTRGVWKPTTYALDIVAKRRTGRALKKDGWRLRYGEFIDVPLARWEEHARALQERAREVLATGIEDKDLLAIVNGPASDVVNYPIDDADATREVYEAQEKLRANFEQDPLADEFRQARAYFALQLASVWGLRTDAAGVDVLRVKTEEEIADLRADLLAEGLVRKDGSRDTKKAAARMVAVCEERGVKPRLTKAGGICLDRDACEDSEDGLLESYGHFGQLSAVLTKDIPMLLEGTRHPIHTRFGFVETGRTSSSKPNVQNLRRLVGIREAFVPRAGFVFAQADYPGLELSTLAQACIDLVGGSDLADAINAGKDPHLDMAARMLGISYEEAKANKKRKDVDAARQTAKVANFGFPGGLGIKRLCYFAKKTYKVDLTEEQAKGLKARWLEQWPEMRAYFAHVATLCASGEGTIVQLRSGRIRAGGTYTKLCNSYFQGLGADAAKRAAWLVSRACYAEPDSPLYGSRIVNFVHDEFFVETPDNENAHDVAHELSRLMIKGANEFLPDVPFREVEPVLMRAWSKEAVAVHDASGRLVPWQPALALERAS